MRSLPHRIVQITDLYEDGRRQPVLVTSDERVVACTERAVQRILGQSPEQSRDAGDLPDA